MYAIAAPAIAIVALAIAIAAPTRHHHCISCHHHHASRSPCPAHPSRQLEPTRRVRLRPAVASAIALLSCRPSPCRRVRRHPRRVSRRPAVVSAVVHLSRQPSPLPRQLSPLSRQPSSSPRPPVPAPRNPKAIMLPVCCFLSFLGYKTKDNDDLQQKPTNSHHEPKRRCTVFGPQVSIFMFPFSFYLLTIFNCFLGYSYLVSTNPTPLPHPQAPAHR